MVHHSLFQVTSWPCHKDSMIQQLSSASWSASMYLPPPPGMEVPRFLFHMLYRAANNYVFIHRNAHRTPLQRPYEGPFHGLERGPKFFKIDIGGKADSVSIYRLKPAHLDPDLPVQVALPPHRGRPPVKKGINGSGGGVLWRQAPR